MNGLTQSQLASFRTALESELERLNQAPSKRNEIAAERSGDELDEVQRQEAVVLAVHTLDSIRDRRVHVQAALARMECGDYGLCLECEDAINPKRLAAAPWAKLCIDCQSEIEMEGRQAGGIRHAA